MIVDIFHFSEAFMNFRSTLKEGGKSRLGPERFRCASYALALVSRALSPPQTGC
jgi:hypothetical protein